MVTTLQKVRAMQDDSGHWYVFPDYLADEYKDSMNAMYETDFENYDLIQKFEEKFSKYRTGGDLNNVQLFAEI